MLDDAIREVAEKRAAVLPLKEAADHALAAANADGVLPSERAHLDLAAQDAAEHVRRAQAEVTAAMENVAAVAREHRNDLLVHADAIQDTARKKSATALAKLAEAEQARRSADSLADWLRVISNGKVEQFRQAHDPTGAHIAAIEDAINGPQRAKDDYDRVMEWMAANYDRVLPPLASASMFPQLLTPATVAELLGVETVTVRAAYAEHRRRRNGGG